MFQRKSNSWREKLFRKKTAGPFNINQPNYEAIIDPVKAIDVDGGDWLVRQLILWNPVFGRNQNKP